MKKAVTLEIGSKTYVYVSLADKDLPAIQSALSTHGVSSSTLKISPLSNVGQARAYSMILVKTGLHYGSAIVRDTA